MFTDENEWLFTLEAPLEKCSHLYSKIQFPIEHAKLRETVMKLQQSILELSWISLLMVGTFKNDRDCGDCLTLVLCHEVST